MVIDPRLYEKVTGRRADSAELLGRAQLQLDERRGQLAEEKERAMNRIRGMRGMGHRWLLIEMIMRRPVAFVVLIVLLLVAAAVGGGSNFMSGNRSTRVNSTPMPSLPAAAPSPLSGE